MKKYIIFDFDGTIARTMDVIVRVLNELAPTLKSKKVEPEDIEVFRNEGWKEALKRFKISPIKLPRIIKMSQGELKKYISDTLLEPGLKQVLIKLKKQGLTLGILTSNTKENVELFLKKNELDVFEFIYADKSLFGKDKVMRRMIKEKNLKCEEIVYIGDEVRDWEACKRAGLDMIGVAWGFNSESNLRKNGLDKIAKEPSELFEKIWDYS